MPLHFAQSVLMMTLRVEFSECVRVSIMMLARRSHSYSHTTEAALSRMGLIFQLSSRPDTAIKRAEIPFAIMRYKQRLYKYKNSIQ